MLDKKHTWWEKMMFAILFLSFANAQYTAISNMLQGNQPEEILKFYTFGQDAYNFYESTWGERTKEDIQKLLLRPDLLINKGGQKRVADSYLGITPASILTKLNRMGRSIDRGPKYLQYLFSAILLTLMFTLGYSHISSGRYLI